MDAASTTPAVLLDNKISHGGVNIEDLLANKLCRDPDFSARTNSSSD